MIEWNGNGTSNKCERRKNKSNTTTTTTKKKIDCETMSWKSFISSICGGYAQHFSKRNFPCKNSWNVMMFFNLFNFNSLIHEQIQLKRNCVCTVNDYTEYAECMAGAHVLKAPKHQQRSSFLFCILHSFDRKSLSIHHDPCK